VYVCLLEITISYKHLQTSLLYGVIIQNGAVKSMVHGCEKWMMLSLNRTLDVFILSTVQHNKQQQVRKHYYGAEEQFLKPVCIVLIKFVSFILLKNFCTVSDTPDWHCGLL